jgi:peptide/nickel transport system permease protein
MTGYIIKRVLAAIPILIFVGLVTFSLVHIAPGDAANIMAGDYAGPDDVKKIRAELGLDKPIGQQFLEWVKRTATGDLGHSIFSGQSVGKLVRQRINPTLSLTIGGGILAVLIGIPLGVVAAWKSNTIVDRVAQVFAALGLAVPGFWLGFILLWAFAVNWRIFPAIGFVSMFDDVGGFFRSIALPCLLLGITGSAVLVRMTRASLLEVFREDYIRTARAKGLGERAVLFRHALRAGAIPIITVLGFLVAGLLTGVVVTETVFTIPGVGRLVAEAVQQRDFPIVQSLLMLLASIYVVVNLLVDIAYAYVDPRVRL